MSIQSVRKPHAVGKVALLALEIALFVFFVCLLALIPTSTLIAEAETANAAEAGEWTLPAEGAAPYEPREDAYLPDNAGYADDSITVRFEEMRAYNTNILLAYVEIKDVTQLRTAMAGRYGSTATVPGAKLAKRSKAVIAINGDYFAFHSKGLVVRQGKTYRNRIVSHFDTLIVDYNGDFHIIPSTTKEKMEPYEDMPIWQSFTFGPALVIDGEKQTTFSRGGSDGYGAKKKTQRAVIAQMDTLSYLLVCTEGPENKGSQGLTILEAAQLLEDLGAKQAYNLDGGSSSTMVFKNKKINALSTGKTRSIGDIIYFATAVAPAAE